VQELAAGLSLAQRMWVQVHETHAQQETMAKQLKCLERRPTQDAQLRANLVELQEKLDEALKVFPAGMLSVVHAGCKASSARPRKHVLLPWLPRLTPSCVPVSSKLQENHYVHQHNAVVMTQLTQRLQSLEEEQKHLMDEALQASWPLYAWFWWILWWLMYG
jgi:hypothetical protein